MTINYATGEIVNAPSYAEVRESIETTKSHLERAAEQVVWQIESQAWNVLGYSSWDEMREAEYKGAAVIVPRADRPELASRLRSTGLSQQQVADTLGVDRRTVARDTSNEHLPITRADSLGRVRPTSYTPKTPASSSGGEATFDAGQTSTSVAPSAQAGESTASSKADVEAAPMVGASMTQGGEGPSDDSAGNRSALTDFVEGSQAVQDARYLANFYKAITKASDYRVFDAERIGRIGNADDMRTLQLEAEGAVAFFEKAKRARSGLRVITGGKS